VRVLSITHQPDAASGVFGEAVREHGHEHDEWDISRVAEPPAPIDSYGAVLVFGGAMHVDQEERHSWLREEHALLERLLADGVPTFGVCLGGQMLAKALDAPVRRMPSSEVGWFDVDLTPEAAGDPVFDGLPARFKAFQWHSYHFELPAGAVPLARNDRCLQGFRAGSAWAIQFHPEVTREDLGEWLRTADPKEDGPLDVEALRVESDELIADWNDFGRRLCGRFLAAAEESGATRRDATTRATTPRS
jgi:GMP synthase-like glutamine amidotransferase